MALTGKQKAAMLLMSLDAATSAELLKGLDAEGVQEITMEVARIDASPSHSSREHVKVAQEFFNSLRKGGMLPFSMTRFLNDTLASVLDEDQAELIRSQVKKTPKGENLFTDLRLASTDELVLALDGEHAQTIAVILSELDPHKSQEVLPLLGKETQLKTVCKMTNPDLVAAEVKQRMVMMISERLKSLRGETLADRPEETLRKLAVVLGGLDKDLRDSLLDEIKKHDEQTCETVRHLMVTWEDIPTIADRSLQEALRSAEASKLALALYGAEPTISEKIRANISERAVATLDEEASLMQEPLENEVLDARDDIVKPLREANEEGKLRFVGR